MVTDFIIQVICGFLVSLFNLLPFKDVTVPTGVLQVFLDIVESVLYFFPWQYCVPILGIILLMQTVRIMMSFSKFILKIFL